MTEDVEKHNVVAVMDMTYNGKLYPFEFEFQDDISIDVAEYIFIDGNYACDCNRSMFLSEKYPDEDIQELDCGDTIEVSNFRIEIRD